MKQNLLYLVFIFLSFAKLAAQQSPSVQPFPSCGIDSAYMINEQLQQSFKTYYENLGEVVKNAHQQQGLRSGNRNSTVLEVPYIIHVLHNGEAIGTGLNISSRQIREMMAAVNRRFNGRNADSVLIIDEFKENYANVGIKFVPVLWDEDGNLLEEPGIERIKYDTVTQANRPFTIEQIQEIQEHVYWKPKRYMNIYITDLVQNIAGFARYPGTSDPPHDAVTIDFEYASPYSFTATHEIGHFLGLMHIWGKEENCSSDDKINDTPLQESMTYFSDLEKESCGNLNMIQNYMDYTMYIDKMDPRSFLGTVLFTEGQKLLMRSVMNSKKRRASLLDYRYLADSIAAPEFMGPSIISLNQEATYIANDKNAISQYFKIFPDSLVELDTVNNSKVKVTFKEPGYYDVKLTKVSALGKDSITKHNYTYVYADSNCTYVPAHNLNDKYYSLGYGSLIGINRREDRAKANFVEWQDTTERLIGIQLNVKEKDIRNSADIKFMVWEQDDSTGGPGNVIHDSWYYNLSSNYVGYQHLFDKPVKVPETFFVGFTLGYFDKYNDIYGIYSSPKGSFPEKGAWQQLEDGTWEKIPDSLRISMYYIKGHEPMAKIGMTDSICAGVPVSMSFSESSGSSKYRWMIDGSILGNGRPDITHIFNDTGRHKLELSGWNECYGYGEVVEKDIVVSSKPEVSLQMDKLAECDSAIGKGTFKYQGGKKPLSIIWSNGGNSDTTMSLNHLKTGKLNVSIEDSIGCKTSQTFNVPGKRPFSVSYDVTGSDCNHGRGGKIRTEITGAIDPVKFNWSNGMERANLNQLVAGDYAVTISDSSRCSVVDTVSVPYLPMDVDLPKDSSVHCEGEKVSLEIGKALEVAWSSGSVGNKFEFLADTSKTIQAIIRERYCTDTNDFQIDVVLTSFEGLSEDSVQGCLGDTLTLTAIGVNSVNWGTGEIGKSIMINQEYEGYITAVSDEGYCTVLDSAFVFMRDCDTLTAVPSRTKPLSNINVFPNPSSGIIHLNVQNPGKEMLFIEVYNAEGKVVFLDELPISKEINQTVNVAELSAGIYQLQLRSNNESKAVVPLMINRQ